jgi:poly(3-hydroxybutyrate) depolymerase
MKDCLMFRSFFFVFPSSVWAAQCATPVDVEFECASREFEECEINVGDVKRYYCQHVPKQGGRLPVILSFHGAGGKAKALVNLWRGQTEQSMMIVVPAAQMTRDSGDCSVRWRQIGTPAADWADLNGSIDSCTGGSWTSDLDFTSALMDKLEERYEVQDFYALGFSNGGEFAYQLYMTNEMAPRFAGFAAAGAGMDGSKLTSMEPMTVNGAYTPNLNIKRPFLFQIGSEDKKNIASEEVIAAVDGNPDCQPIQSAADVMKCFSFTHLNSSVGVYDMPTRRALTRDWLVEFNNADPNRHESLYPNLGQGPEPSDHTMTVREDYLEKLDENSAAVSVLTTLDGGHDWPGWGGNRAPCPSRNCDVDLLHEILQFWRAHGGMKLPVP